MFIRKLCDLYDCESAVTKSESRAFAIGPSSLGVTVTGAYLRNCGSKYMIVFFPIDTLCVTLLEEQIVGFFFSIKIRTETITAFTKWT